MQRKKLTPREKADRKLFKQLEKLNREVEQLTKEVNDSNEIISKMTAHAK